MPAKKNPAMANQLPTGFAASQITSPAATTDLRRLLREELAEVYERLSAFEERQERLERLLERLVKAKSEATPVATPARVSSAAFTGAKAPAKMLIDGFKCLAELHSPRGKKHVPVMITGTEPLPDGSLGFMAMRLSGGPKQKWRKVGPKPADAFYLQPKGWHDDAADDDVEAE